MDPVFKRISIRKFTDEVVDDEKIRQIIRAGMAAPSSKNQRPWEFYVVRDRTVLEDLSKCSPFGVPIRNARVAIVVCYRNKDLKEPEMVLLDMSCCCENMLIEAAELGLGSVWISFAPRKQRQEPAEKVMNLPEHLNLFTVLPVGYPMGNLKPLDRFEEERIHWPEK